eukprot:3929592-Alexandrium_andersonii.AAC.1
MCIRDRAALRAGRAGARLGPRRRRRPAVERAGRAAGRAHPAGHQGLSLIHISEPTRLALI